MIDLCYIQAYIMGSLEQAVEGLDSTLEDERKENNERFQLLNG